jgi:hypothetical protein
MEAGLSSVIVPLEQFSDDLDRHLGRANGNIYLRKPGVEGVHDGQIMVRLKKKRFIVVDYGIVPTQADLQAAAIHAHVATPDGAGKTKCITPNCPKVGVPVLLYDSDPSEAASLYLRSGLCFTCQRNLNEKRRTQRKRKSDDVQGGQRVKHNGQIIDLSSDALVINGPMDGVKKHADGFTPEELAADLHTLMREALADTERLLTGLQPNPETSAVAYAAAAAAAAVNNHLIPSDIAVTSAAVDASSSGLIAQQQQQQQQHHITSADDDDETDVLYEKAFTSASKALYLLTQWKASWDASNANVHDQAMMPLLMAADKEVKVKEEVQVQTQSGANGDDVFQV